MAPPPDPPRTVLFICIGNAGRSLMAEAMFNAAPPDGWRAISGGVRPAPAPNERTGPMLAEIGLTLPDHAPQLVTNEQMDRASLRVTMGCLDDASCPARLKKLELRDWGLPDPAKLDDAGFRRVRDQLRQRVEGLRAEIELERRRSAARSSPTPP
ncbi:MAG: low molecular weight phosphatase family protein [Thermoplasmata archaeon]|nr:low molecular weight phosphatase family protein [Thermoplasmata archaeon]